MELIRKNIHMECLKSTGCLQLPMEEDKIVPDQYPDVDQICFYHGEVWIEEVRTYTDYLCVKGELGYTLLYHSKESECSVLSLKGSMPIEEKINMNGLTGGDTATVNAEITDFRIGLVNSRKLSIQAIVTLCSECKSLKDHSLLLDVKEEKMPECKKEPIRFSQLSVSKKDVIRIKEERELPAAYPNILRGLWSSVRLTDIDYRLEEGKILVQGNLRMFALYEGEGEDHPIRFFEKEIPVSREMECQGVSTDHIGDISISLGHSEVGIKPDLDGESRLFTVDASLQMDIRIYEEENAEIITDMYSVEKEIVLQREKQLLSHVQDRNCGKMKLSKMVSCSETEEELLQVVYCEGKLHVENKQIVEEGMNLKGFVQMNLLYITKDDKAPYGRKEVSLPFNYILKCDTERIGNLPEIRAFVENPEVILRGEEGLNITATLRFEATLCKEVMVDVITNVEVNPIDSEKIRNLPGMCIYVVNEGDSLWKIGKKYYTSVAAITELNNLSSALITPGQKLLVTKGIEG